MKVYQLKIKDLDIVLDPVFGTLEAAILFKNKYRGRKIEVLEVDLDTPNDKNYIYRIETMETDGNYLEEEIFPSLESALKILKSNQKIVRENIISSSTFKYVIADEL